MSASGRIRQYLCGVEPLDRGYDAVNGRKSRYRAHKDAYRPSFALKMDRRYPGNARGVDQLVKRVGVSHVAALWRLSDIDVAPV